MSEFVDLHGHEGLLFIGFDEETGYLERVTVKGEPEARGRFCDEYSLAPDEVDLERIFMRWVDEIDRDNEPELDGCESPCWVECGCDHPDAVPFWKDRP